MIIYGTALLAACHLLGLFLGDLLGSLIGVKSNVGGVGIAMLLLIFARLYLHKRGWLPAETEQGVAFWGAMYIPVVVAMAATQNVVAPCVAARLPCWAHWVRCWYVALSSPCSIAAAASTHGSRKQKPRKTHWPDTGATSCKCWKKYWHITGW
ncbi:malonate transporter subunit MadL [Aquitalea pelogenes]|uniref:malonate transporter subunit MadL n=1 Tax=Aquitalea pelogenes TaxID=1293573 RepID=UPI000B2C7171|nr:malonate transporter subunit MadL [Aquitalea pelogenes]